MYPQTVTVTHVQVQTFFNRVYNWMGAGLLLTAATAWFTVHSPALLGFVASSFFILILAELALVWFLGASLQRLSAVTAGTMFAVYAILNGLTLSGILLAYTGQTVALAFVTSAAMFVGLSLYGYSTKADLSPIGRAAIMALIGLIVTAILNFFLRSDLLSWLLSVAGVLIFSALTAYDTQKLRQLAVQGVGGETGEKLAIYGALTLYLDFINLFLSLLRLFNRR
ncbi:MAG: Bax inhibitor-1/YccA family protein [Thermaceae bacterium]|nr:Bax inhibitor-1/YccA family protein [Thermaceae bacterium]